MNRESESRHPIVRLQTLQALQSRVIILLPQSYVHEAGGEHRGLRRGLVSHVQGTDLSELDAGEGYKDLVRNKITFHLGAML